MQFVNAKDWLQYGDVKVLCNTFNATERFEVLYDNKEMIKLVGGPLCVNAVVEMRVMIDETSHHQNTHWRESKQMQRVQLFRNHTIRHMLTHSAKSNSAKLEI